MLDIILSVIVLGATLLPIMLFRIIYKDYKEQKEIIKRIRARGPIVKKLRE